MVKQILAMPVFSLQLIQPLYMNHRVIFLVKREHSFSFPFFFAQGEQNYHLLGRKNGMSQKKSHKNGIQKALTPLLNLTAFIEE